jgi:hypothetical protein
MAQLTYIYRFGKTQSTSRMKHNVLACLFLLSAVAPLASYAQRKKELYAQYQVQELKNPPTTVCYASTEASRYRVPLPKAYLERSRFRTEATEFIVEYVGFPPDARAAFQRAVDIWATLITSPVPIRIRATWEPLANNVLGGARPGTYLRSPQTPRFPVWYPVALFEKITGVDFDPSQPDIVASFNSSNTDWFFGTSGQPGANQYDLTTTVLHEIAHGLGFSSSFGLNDQNQGSWGLAGLPFAYDLFLRDNQDRDLTDTLAFRNPSVQLRTALTNQNLFFVGRDAVRRNANRPVRLYAPTPFERGSSVSHLDFTTFNNTDNQLMVHAQTRGSSSLDPGPITMSVLTDIGWVSSRLVHQPGASNDRAGTPVTLRARIASDTAVNLNSTRVNLVWSTDRFTSSQTIAMQPTTTRGEYQATIPAATANRTVNYYIEAVLPGNNSITSPGNAPRNTWFFASLASDNTAPTIAHEPPRFLLETEASFDVLAEVNDALGVDTAFVEFQVNNDPLTRVGMGRDSFTGFVIQGGTGGNTTGFNTSNGGSGSFTGRLLLAGLRDGAVLRYRIVARDRAQGRNQATSPATGFHEVRIVGFGNPRETYENNFNNVQTAAGDFIGTDFRVEQPRGFEQACLNSDHPYRDGSGANGESNYVSLLRFPITVRPENAFMRFDEIVLVEPGETGAVFGDLEFWDYVIVEGSRDRGRTWLPLLDGYDSRSRPEWLAAYNQRIANNNSTTEGTPSLFRSRQIDIGRIFRPGEQVVLRFRLFADQSANGWGWAIDNLQVQTAALGLEEYLVSYDDVRLYPNPASGELQVTARFKKPVQQLRLSLTDAVGRQIHADALPTSGLELDRTLSLAGLASGMYLVHLDLDGSRLTKKVFVR